MTPRGAGTSRAASARMANQEKNIASDPDETKGTANSEDGRGVTVESGPEDQMMRCEHSSS